MHKQQKSNWRPRARLYEIIDLGKEGDKASKIYDGFMIAAILISLIPLAFRETNVVFDWIDRITIVIFIVDYLLRLITADFQIKKGRKSFFLYPLSIAALIDLAAILPALSLFSPQLKFLSVVRLVRLFKILKIFRYSENIFTLIDIILDQAQALLTVGVLAGSYILIASLTVFNVEPQTFETFFDALYWSVMSLTTVGYGDIYPVTTIGRVVSMASAIFGIAVVALPTGIISASYMEILRKPPEEREKRKAMRGLSREQREKEWARWNKEQEEKRMQERLEREIQMEEHKKRRMAQRTATQPLEEPGLTTPTADGLIPKDPELSDREYTDPEYADPE